MKRYVSLARMVVGLAAVLAAGLMMTPAVVLAGGVLPDLSPTKVIATTVYEDVANPVSVVVANGGDADSGAFSTTLHTSDGQVFTQSVASISPSGWPAYVNYSWTPPDSGSHVLTFTIDSTGIVTESNEANNVITSAIDVLPLAPVTVTVRVEGINANIFSDTVSVLTSIITDSIGVTHTLDRPTALGALDAAAQTSVFTYVVSSAWGALFVTEVAGEEASGADGWLYRVDWASPDVGAADYALGPANAQVLWYYGAWDAKPLSLTLSADSVAPGEAFDALVKAYDDFTATWSPVPTATVFAAGHTFTTDAGGQATVSGLPCGYHTVYADKGSYAAYTRSNAEPITVAGVNVAFQGGMSSGTDRWVNVVTMTLSGGTPSDGTYVATTTNAGAYTMPDVVSGLYTITVVSPHTLANEKTGVTIISPSTTVVDMCTLREGDADMSGQVTIADFGLLAASYLKICGAPGFNAMADFDRSCQVNIADFGLLAANYLTMGPVACP